ncbi:hypothetical protein AXXA_16252 [Achromobacter insuavis AXX-A]|uniref:Uncharacterized protein n=1 Tax=Achromobacter insuavis AXX-A TaxID=1003200 RepID=F7T2T8_9BURK|nr:hypothetical protein AXXA_16252 [Achromobacter insuavis AXX-A]
MPTRSAVLVIGSSVGGSPMVATEIVPPLTGVAQRAGVDNAVKPIAPAASRLFSPPPRREVRKFMILSPEVQKQVVA